MGDLAWVRVGMVTAAVLALATAIFVPGMRRRLRDFYWAECSALNLGLARIIIARELASDRLTTRVARYAQMDPALRRFPPGWQELGPSLPMDAESITLAGIAMKVCATLAMFGVLSRATMGLTCALALYVLAIPQFFGKINHYHFLYWCALVLAFSRCGDALSVDALWKTFRAGKTRLVTDPRPSVRYGRPMRLLWLVIGLVYFFPGFWKLWDAGDLWLWGDNLVRLLRAKWIDLVTFRPALRVDLYPWLWRPMSVATVLFETLFVFSLVFPRAKWALIATGYSFHTATDLLMKISFGQLKRCYVVFIDVPSVARFLRLDRVPVVDRLLVLSDDALARADEETRRAPVRIPRLTTAAGVVLLAGILSAGFMGHDSWPLAVMPRFHRRFPTHRDNFSFVLHRKDGTVLDGYDSEYFKYLKDAPYLRQMRDAARTRRRKARRRKLHAIARSMREVGDPIAAGDELTIVRLRRSLVSGDPFGRPSHRRVVARMRIKKLD